MEVRITPDTRKALEADLSLRCFHRTKFTLDSRRSEVVIPWTQSLAETFSRAMLEDIGQEISGFSVQLNVVQLLRRNVVLICFDLFLGKCAEEVRNRINQSFEQPIHQIILTRNVCHIQRKKGLDATVAAEYTGMGNLDKGPRPFFSDFENPPVYCDGRRVEDPDGDEVG